MYPNYSKRLTLMVGTSIHNNNNNIYPGYPLALAVFSGALQIIITKIKIDITIKAN